MATYRLYPPSASFLAKKSWFPLPAASTTRDGRRDDSYVVNFRQWAYDVTWRSDMRNFDYLCLFQNLSVFLASCSRMNSFAPWSVKFTPYVRCVTRPTNKLSRL